MALAGATILLVLVVFSLGNGPMFSFLRKPSDMILIVGLGNPGSKYEGNRHNIGFMAIDAIAEDYMFPAFKEKFQGFYSEGRVDGKKVGLLKPQTYMNESGRSVGAAAKFYKITPNQIYVFHDELDLEPGKLRVRKGGGNAGHNGLKSIQAHLGKPDFWRIRMGIGHPGDKNRVSGYVLSDFAKEERESWLEKQIPAVAKHLELLLSDEKDNYMTQISRDAPAPSKKEQ